MTIIAMIWILDNANRIGTSKPSHTLARLLADRLGCATRILPVSRPTTWGKLFPDLPPFLPPNRYNESLVPPWPHITVSCGRQIIPAALAIKRAAGSAVYSIHVQPTSGQVRPHFDAIVTSTGDSLRGDNVFPITGSPEDFSSLPLSRLRSLSAARYAHLPRPLTTILIGGPNQAFHFDRRAAERLMQEIRQALEQTGGGYLATLSRRSPPFLQPVMQELLQGLPGQIWNHQGESPYEEYLAQADYIAVTADSINMISEACAVGKPVFILPLRRRRFKSSRKYDLFHNDLIKMNAARFFEGELFDWPGTRLDETRPLADQLVRRIQQWGGLGKTDD